MNSLRNGLYNLFIHDVTMLCYRNSLPLLARGSRILDVGIGNGTMIRAFHELIRSRNLAITGIDINRCYLDHCCAEIRTFGLGNHIAVIHEPVESYEPPGPCWFDAILFSMSFMLLADPAMVIDRILPWLKPGGSILFFQTMFRRRSRAMDLVKPRLKYLTTIDFGRAIYEGDFFGLLRDKGLHIDEDRFISRAWFAGEYRLITATPDMHGMAAFRSVTLEGEQWHGPARIRRRSTDGIPR